MQESERAFASTDAVELLKRKRREFEAVGASNRGPPGFTEETPHILTIALSHIRDGTYNGLCPREHTCTAFSVLPDAIKEDYNTVLQLLPNLAQSESDPTRFLRRESFHPWAAAQRLAYYWEFRRAIFNDRWLLPFSDSGEGSLDQDDIAVLRSGWITVIMPFPDSTFKTPVVYIDDNKVDGDPIDEKLRALFYVFSVLGGDNVSQTDGVILIQNKMSDKIVSIPSMTIQLEMITRTLPVRISKYFILRPHNVERGSLFDMGHTSLFQAGVKLFGATVTQFVFIDTLSTAASVLASSLAIPPTCVPVDFGGQWIYDRLMEWQVQVGMAAMASDPPASASVLRMSAAVGSVSTSAQDEGGGDARDEEISRMRNALYARRSYRRKKAKETGIDQQVRELEAERERLVAERQRLENLFGQAMDIVRCLNSSDEEEEEEAVEEDVKPPPFSRNMFDEDPRA
eukprot:scaffold2120_cov169-Amphora_coffeaeformis.AAC.2